MVINIFDKSENKENFKNIFRFKKIKNKFLLTTNQGNWIVLNKKEYDKFIKNKLSNKLFKNLEEKGIIVTKNNFNNILEDNKKRINYLFHGTSLHIIVPTTRCNQKCIYCHSAAKNESAHNCDMNEKTAKKTLDFIFQSPTKNITIEFQGGDTLLNIKIFQFIVKKAKKMNQVFNKNIRFALVTNLTLMTDKLIGWIIKENISISTSLDGPKIVHDKNRIFEEGEPTYDKVTYWIKRIKEKYNYPIGALMVTTKHSLPYYKEIVDEYVKWGFTNLQIKYINKLGFAENTWEKIGYTIEEFIEFWKQSVDYMIKLNKKGIKIKSRYVGLILQKILTKEDPSFLDFRNPCGIVCGQMAYDYNGDIYCCDEGRMNEIFKLGNTKKNEYSKVLSSKQSQQLISASINDNYICDNCVYKTWCGLCPVIAYAEQGNIIPKIPTFSKCKLAKAQFDYVFEKILFNKNIRKILFSWLNNWNKKNAKKYDINKILNDNYNLKNYTLKEISGGYNKIILINKKEDKKILKILNNLKKNKKEFSSINDYLIFLNKNKISAPTLIKNKKGSYYIKIAGKISFLYNYIKGEEFSFKDKEIKNSAKFLIKFQDITNKYKGKIFSREFLKLHKLIDEFEKEIFLKIKNNEEKVFLKTKILRLEQFIKNKNY